MPEQIGYEEDWQDGTIKEAKVGVAANGTRLYVAVKPNGDGTYRLAKADQRDTTVIDGEGLSLLPFALDRLRERFVVDDYGLDGADRTDDSDMVSADEALEQLDEATAEDKENAEGPDDESGESIGEDGEEQSDRHDVDETDEEYYESAETYLEEVDEATTREIADAMGIDDAVDVHPELNEIDDEMLVTRPHPDDGRKKLYSLRQDGSPPGEVDEGTVVAVAEHYETLTEVAEDLEVDPLRAHAILEAHDVRDEVVWHE